MKSKSLLWIIFMVGMVISTAYAAYAIDYFTYRMNFPPGTSHYHVQEMNFTGNLTITLPVGFTFVNSTNSYTVSGTNHTWENITNGTVYYTIQSPSSCTEGNIYKSAIYNNNALVDEFVYVCISDEKIVDYKVEYGHGCGNYLATDEPYISNESATLFNLVRVWNIGNYLDPDEDAKDAEISCFYEYYPVRTYGRVDVGYETSRINGTFSWDEIYGGYWFRIGVLSQDVSGKSVGGTYSVNCTDLSYYFGHHRVVASFPNYTLYVRSPEPLIKNVTNLGTKELVTIKNYEQYPIYSVVINFEIDNVAENIHLAILGSGESVTFLADANTNTTISYIPSWERHCFSPVYYKQTLTNVSNITINLCPTTTNIPSQAWAENTSNNNAFDLDDYFTDPENGTLTYGYTGTNSINVTISPATNEVSFSQPDNFTGIEYVMFYANDGNCTTYSNNVTLFVYPVNATTQNVTVTQVIERGGGKTRRIYVYVPVNVTEEKCQEIWLCSEWSECYPEGFRNRTCNDLNKCETKILKPETREKCIPEIEEPAPFEEAPAPVCKLCNIIPFIILLLIIIIFFLLSPAKGDKDCKKTKNEVLKWKKSQKERL